MRIACIGEAMVELSLAADGQARIGYAGDTLNTAIYLKRAAPGLEVAYVTRLGQDSFSGGMRDFIAAEGIDTGAIETSETRQVGLYAITTDAEGERSFTYWRENAAARELFQRAGVADFSALGGFDLLYLSAITLAILPPEVRQGLCDWLAGYRQRGGRVAFDSNYRPRLWEDAATARQVITAFWKCCDIALPSVDDEIAIYGDASDQAVLARLRGWGVREGALKRGPLGPLSLGEPVEADYPPAAEVRDTTAAGDSFNAGYLAALLQGGDQPDALRAGHDLAARVVGFKGAIMPR